GRQCDPHHRSRRLHPGRPGSASVLRIRRTPRCRRSAARAVAAIHDVDLRAGGDHDRCDQRSHDRSARARVHPHPLQERQDHLMTPPSDLTARLGLAPDARAIILNADDFGMCHAANEAIGSLLRDGHLDSATVMAPCAWSPAAFDFAAAHPELRVGAHLVLTSEWTRYRWRPLTGPMASLVDRDGYFPAEVR